MDTTGEDRGPWREATGIPPVRRATFGDLGAALAAGAFATRSDERHDDTFPGLETDARADADDLTGGLVAPDRRQLHERSQRLSCRTGQAGGELPGEGRCRGGGRDR